MVLVYGACLVLAAVTAGGLAALVGSHVEQARLQATVDGDRAAASVFLSRVLTRGDLDPTIHASRRTALTELLEQLRHELGTDSMAILDLEGAPIVQAGATASPEAR